MNTREFFLKGWCRFPLDTTLLRWVYDTLPAARKSVVDPEFAEWYRCGDTWFAGVNALPNDQDGAVEGGRPLAGDAVEFIRQLPGMTNLAWDRAQVSVCYPGYPKRMSHETESAFQYRVKRDATHIDGLLPTGPRRRRHLREFHAFLLGVPMNAVDAGASPLVVWEGSHKLAREMFVEVFSADQPDHWPTIDITEKYHALRNRVFETCRRIEIAAQPGEAYVLHRLALHGIAPWTQPVDSKNGSRMVCYFRPEFEKPSDWLDLP